MKLGLSESSHKLGFPFVLRGQVDCQVQIVDLQRAAWEQRSCHRCGIFIGGSELTKACPDGVIPWGRFPMRGGVQST